MKIYFLGGLGCNAYHPLDFFEQVGLPIQYLDLYGLEAIQGKEELLAWFGQIAVLTQDVVLIGHSLGADFAAYLASHYKQVRHIILLDGGFLDMEAICPLEQELAEAQAYLEQETYPSLEAAVEHEKEQAAYWSSNLEKASRASWTYDEERNQWKLALSWPAVSNLLQLRRQVYGSLSQLADRDLDLLIPQGSEDMPEWRRQALDSLPDFVQLTQVPDCSHQMHLDRPAEIGRLVRNRILPKGD